MVLGHPVRKKLIFCLPLQSDIARVKDLDFEVFESILAFVPTLYRPAFRTIL